MNRFHSRDKVGGVVIFPAITLPFDIWNDALLQNILDYVDDSSDVKAVNLTPVTQIVSNTVAQQVLCSFTIVGGSLLTNRVIRHSLFGYISSDDILPAGLTITLQYGATSIVLLSFSEGEAVPSLSFYPFRIEIEITGKGSDQQQLLTGKYESEGNVLAVKRALVSENSTQDKTVSILVQMTQASPNNVIAAEVCI